MAFFNLPFGVRIAGADPIDGDRYVATGITSRDSLIGSGREFNGLQVFVETEKQLYILKDKTVPTWESIGTSSDLGLYLALSGGTGGPYNFTGSTTASSLLSTTITSSTINASYSIDPIADDTVDIGNAFKRFRNLHTKNGIATNFTASTKILLGTREMTEHNIFLSGDTLDGGLY